MHGEHISALFSAEIEEKKKVHLYSRQGNMAIKCSKHNTGFGEEGTTPSTGGPESVVPTAPFGLEVVRDREIHLPSQYSA